MSVSSVSDLSVPDVPMLSPVSGVSIKLQEEYDELLKFAVVEPKYNRKKLAHTLANTRELFLPSSQFTNQRVVAKKKNDGDEDEFTDGTDVTPINDILSPVDQQAPNDRLRSIDKFPDFGGRSPIRDKDDIRQHQFKFTDATDVTPINDILSSVDQQATNDRLRGIDRLPDFGGWSPIQDKDNIRRRQEHIPSQYFSTAHGRKVQVEEKEYNRVYMTTVDPDILTMEHMMDQWCLDLKRNVLAEFGQSKIRIVEQGRQQLLKELEKHASEKLKLLEEMNSLKELLATYEKSIKRKDHIISDLTHVMNKQRDKNELMRTFCEWKVKHNDLKRENFCLIIAKMHHERYLKRKVWDAWHGVIETKWRLRIEKACQAKAQEVCVQLTNDYQDRLGIADKELQAVRTEIGNMNQEREHYKEMMKKAFMRGVCALNLEAMMIFHNGAEKENRDIVLSTQRQDEFDENIKSSLAEKNHSASKFLLQDQVIPNGIAHLSAASQAKPQSTKDKSSSGSVAFSSKVSSKVDSGKSLVGVLLAPPMSSVIVERHQPVSKQTMPHALAGKYQKPSTEPSGDRHCKIAGQIQTGKHVK